MKRTRFQARWPEHSRLDQPCPLAQYVYVPDDPWVLLHGHEYSVNPRAYIAQDDLSVSEDKVSIEFYLLEPHPGLASPNHLVP